MAAVGPSVLELEKVIDDLNRNLKSFMVKNQHLVAKEKEQVLHLEKLNGVILDLNAGRENLQQELDAVKTLLDTKEKENAVMKHILQGLNINIEDYEAQLSAVLARNNRLMQTQEQIEYADMAAMELLVKEEDMRDIERDVEMLASAEDREFFERKKRTCLEVLGQLKTLFEHLSDTLTSQKFNTGTLESRRLSLMTDTTAMLARIEEARDILVEFGSFDGS
jgi:chromosome segregation ATPase